MPRAALAGVAGTARSSIADTRPVVTSLARIEVPPKILIGVQCSEARVRYTDLANFFLNGLT
jgi:hypothetical protein